MRTTYGQRARFWYTLNGMVAMFSLGLVVLTKDIRFVVPCLLAMFFMIVNLDRMKANKK